MFVPRPEGEAQEVKNKKLTKFPFLHILTSTCCLLTVLLVGMQTCAATVENSMEFPQKIKNGTAF